jgi:hypothetical protein
MFGQGLNFGGLIGTAAAGIDFLIVAGGGGGGPNHGGGGGAGGYKTTTTYSGSETPLVVVLGTAYDVTVGPGGAGALAGANGTSGSNSNFNGIISTGGGGGAPNNGAGVTGGSGGGGSRGGGGGSGTTGQGNDGATGTSLSGGGGGGANTAGSTGSSANNGGNGGDGISNSISGTSTPYAGGGGGNGYEGSGGTGGTGGGGNGGQYGGSGEYQGTNGTFNTGGGGGGNYSNSGTFQMRGMNGGSGTVILRYPTATVSSYAVTGTLDTVANTAYPIANKAYYKLNANANDSSGNGYNGTATSVTYAAGRFGNAAVFNGSSSYIQTNLNLTASYTISFWSKKAISSNNGYAIGSTDANIRNGIIMNPYADATNSGMWNFIPRNASGGNVSRFQGGTSTVNVWQHIAITFNGTLNGGTTTFYQDGSLMSNIILGTNPLPNSTPANITSNPLVIGRAGAYSLGDFFNGTIDQVRIFNTAISAANVTSLYNEGTVVESTDGNDSILQFIGGSGDITFS